MPILRASVVEAKKFEEVARKLWTPFVNPEEVEDDTFKLHPDAFRFEPQGARVHIAVAPLPAKLGSIWVPPEADDINGLGIVVAVGPQAHRESPHPHGVYMDEPSDLLYAQVMLKKFAGTPIAFDAGRGSNFYDHVITCSARDILAVDFPENRPADATIDGLGNMLGQQI